MTVNREIGLIKDSASVELMIKARELKEAGVTSFKIEGRMKSPYYVANVTNAYRRAIDNMDKISEDELEILNKESNQYKFYIKA